VSAGTRADQLRQQWDGLNPAQADGRECVVCESTYLDLAAVLRGETPTAASPRVPVGFAADTGSQVFACVGICAALAYPPA